MKGTVRCISVENICVINDVFELMALTGLCTPIGKNQENNMLLTIFTEANSSRHAINPSGASPQFVNMSLHMSVVVNCQIATPYFHPSAISLPHPCFVHSRWGFEMNSTY